MAGSSSFTVMTNIFVTEFADSVKTFREKSIISLTKMYIKGKEITGILGFLFYFFKKSGLHSTMNPADARNICIS